MSRRDDRAKLYRLSAWRHLSDRLRNEHPICQRCGRRLSEHTHHIKSPFDFGLDYSERLNRLLDPDNCLCLCAQCHMEVHKEIEEKKKQWRRDKEKEFYIRY